jgi:Transposase DDE domain
MQAFEREVCQRLPLADAVLRLLDYVSADAFLDGVFERHHGRSYEDVLSFPLFTHLIADTLLARDQASAHQSFLKAHAQGTLPTCVEALYGKLRRVPLPLSQGFLEEATHQLRQVFPDARDALPASLQGLDVHVFDGKKLKYVAKRLKPVRLLRGHILGGKLLVVLHAATGLAVAMQADADGETADNPLVAGAVGQVRLHPATMPRLWIGDRLFCDLKQIPLLAAGGDFFLLRYQSKVGFHLDPLRPARAGTDARGIPYTDDWGWLGAVGHPQRQYVRRITLHRPGLSALVVVTNLLDADTYPAADLLEAYLRRWGIEKPFQRVTEVFDLRHVIGGSPQATVFQAAFCFLLSNVIQAVRGYIAAAQHRPPETISTQLLFEDVTEELTSWHKFVSVAQTQEWVQDGVQTAEQVRAYLRRRLAGVWNDRRQKAPTTRRAPKGKTEYLKGGHSSVYRILHGLHEVCSDPDESKA